MLLPNALRKAFARLFSRLPLDGFPEMSPLRRPCPVTPPFRPALEMLERRLMPTVTATYTAASGLLVVNASSSTTATAMTVTASTNNQVTLALTGDTFTLQGDAAGASSGDFALSNGSSTLLIYTGSAPLVNFDITQRSNNEPLTFGLAAATSGVTNVNITGTGDGVTFNAINDLSGNLVDTSASVFSTGTITVGGSVTITGSAVGTGIDKWGVYLNDNVTAGTNGNITITGIGSGSGSGSGFGVYAVEALSAGGSVSVTGVGRGTGNLNNGIVLGGLVTAGTSGSITLRGIGSAQGSGGAFGIIVESAVSAGGTVSITGTGQGTQYSNYGVYLSSSVTAGGNVTISGSSVSGTGFDCGVYVLGAVSSGGSITITGTGAGSGIKNWGVDLKSSVTAGSSGSVTIAGSGSARGAGSDFGIYIDSFVSGGGSVAITGTGQGTGAVNYGFKTGGDITAGGNATITGSGANSITGTGYNFGAYVEGEVSSGGVVTITGTGSGTESHDWGVKLNDIVRSGSSGNVTITGTGSVKGRYDNYGVYATQPITAGGSVIITGTGGGTGQDNEGVKLSQSVKAGTAGNIVIKGTAATSGADHAFGVYTGGGLSAGGSVTISGTALGSLTSNYGVNVEGYVIAGSSGNITITGSGGGGTGNNFGVKVGDALTAGGTVTITGSGKSHGTSYSEWGVMLENSVTAGSSITITGTSGTGTSQTFGVYVDEGVTAGDSVTITGIGQGSGSGEEGVLLHGNVQSGTSGNVTIRGSGSSSGYSNNYGVYTNAAVSGGGTITITGTGNGTGTDNDGVVLKGIAAVVSKVNGILSISGSSNSAGTSASNYGVYIAGGGQVKATGSAAITVTGIGGQGSGNSNIGILVTGAGSAVTGSSGGISINGTGRGSGSGSYGVAIELGGLVQTASTGAVSLVGQAPSTTAALYFDFGHSSKVEVATGNVALTGDIIDLSDPDSISSTSTSGTSHLAFQAYTHGRAIVVGAASDVPNALTFTNTDLAAIAQGGGSNGFGLITLGSASGANPMSFGTLIAFSTNLSQPIEFQPENPTVVDFTTNLSLQAQGGLTLQIPNTNPSPGNAVLNVEAILYLNNDPLHLLAPEPALANGAQVTLIYTAGGTAGTTFLNQPQGSIVTDTAGHHYYISYTTGPGKDVVLTATTAVPPNPGSPGAGTGRGRGSS